MLAMCLLPQTALWSMFAMARASFKPADMAVSCVGTIGGCIELCCVVVLTTLLCIVSTVFMIGRFLGLDLSLTHTKDSRPP